MGYTGELYETYIDLDNKSLAKIIRKNIKSLGIEASIKSDIYAIKIYLKNRDDFTANQQMDLIKFCRDILNMYNADNSKAEIDYFDVKFYAIVQFDI